ncbi:MULTISPECIES: diguanylate cyclase [Cycloclasticus]|jgi:diguanylate cyclase (GGDEF)-like protein|uniref:GGDEF domain-containing protein n=1 Tax=Cycloclasticus TaxID=34067 RepID=UPI0009214B8A|nr:MULTISPECIES: diguanylate cyclase [Cycloclasticus]PHR48608.1 MAG: diguanylate phosphodiesterase [Cycloclasticus sp.]SHI48310.1 diguanylate cyclase (GGDEF) domain-containing protein [Cycloclasticus pugetii]|tara:strand:+ start:13 stop:477 length:465 start_codon:yes stop_codon:yes gene_type:complete
MTHNQQESRCPITGLPDAATFSEQTEQLLEFCTRTHANALMLFITFDTSVSEINGQQNDLALKAIAKRLLSKARDSDIYAHLGEMNFANLTIETSEKHTPILIEKLKIELAQPITLMDGSSIKLNTKVGLAEYPKQGKSYAELIEVARKNTQTL